jgi:hypothetical protein
VTWQENESKAKKEIDRPVTDATWPLDKLIEVTDTAFTNNSTVQVVATLALRLRALMFPFSAAIQGEVLLGTLLKYSRYLLVLAVPLYPAMRKARGLPVTLELIVSMAS